MSKAIESLSTEDKALLKAALDPMFAAEFRGAVANVEDYGARNARFPSPVYGERCIVRKAFQIGGIWYSREFEYRPAGSLNVIGEVMPADDWLGGRTWRESNNIENLTEGNLDQDRINDLEGDLNALRSEDDILAAIAAFARLKLDSFSLTPAQAEVGDTITALNFALAVSGGPENGLMIERADGQRVMGVAPGERSIAATAIPAPAGVIFVGDSQPWEWAAEYAAALGLAPVIAARPAHTIHRQAIMVGATRLGLTLAGGILPAAGSSVVVSLVNGGATIEANPDAFLHSALGGTDSIGLTLTVAGGTRHCILSHDLSGAPNVYVMEQAEGGGAVAVSPDALAVPDFAAMLQSTHRVVVMGGHNDMRQHDPAGSFAGIRDNTDAIMSLTGNNPHPVEINDFWPADTIEERALIPWIETHSQWLRGKFPGAIKLDTVGRTTWERLRNGDKVIPAADRKPGDSLHLSASGRAKWTGHNQECNGLHFAGALPISASTSFTARARGAVPDYPVVEETRTASISFLHRRYWGVSGSATLNSAGVVGLAGTDLSSGRAKSATVTAADQYVYVAYPAEWGDPSSYKLFGFGEAPVKTTVSVTKSNGATVSYIVLRSPLKLTGPVSVEVQ